MSAFYHYFKDFAVVYHVTMAPYNSKSSSRCLLTVRARIGVFSESTRFILSSAFLWLCCMLFIFKMSIKEIKNNLDFQFLALI